MRHQFIPNRTKSTSTMKKSIKKNARNDKGNFGNRKSMSELPSEYNDTMKLKNLTARLGITDEQLNNQNIFMTLPIPSTTRASQKTPFTMKSLCEQEI